MSALLNVLLVEDSEDDALLVLRALRQGGLEINHRRVDTAGEMNAALEAERWDVIISDYAMPNFSGPAALKLARSQPTHIPFILVSGQIGEETAVQAMRAGADDYLLKGQLQRLVPAVQRELQKAEERRREMARTAELEQQVCDRTAELERSNAELEQYASRAAHDLQAPLNSVFGLMKRLEQLSDGSGEETHATVNLILNLTTRMQQLIGGVLAYSHVGAALICPQSTSCAAALAKAMENLTQDIKKTGVFIQCDQLPYVDADPAELVQLFQNLIHNAIKFGRKDHPEVRIGVTEENGEQVFSVQDNGIGIRPADAQRIFQLFHRLHGRDEYPGNGIGLAVCKKIVERHGGRIWVQSNPAEGAAVLLHAGGGE